MFQAEVRLFPDFASTLYKFLKLKWLEAYLGLGLGLRLRHTGLGTAAVAEESTAGEAVHPLHVAAEAVRHLIDAAKAALRLRGDTVGGPPYLLCPNVPPHLLPSLKTKTIGIFLFFFNSNFICYFERKQKNIEHNVKSNFSKI